MSLEIESGRQRLTIREILRTHNFSLATPLFSIHGGDYLSAELLTDNDLNTCAMGESDHRGSMIK